VPSATNAQQQKPSLFDHLIGAGKQRRWHGEVERLRSLEIDDELKSGGNAWLWNDRSWRKAPFIHKRDIVVDNEGVENFPVSNRQGDRKTLSACSGAGRALALLDME
jgi:hypothetical protein